MYFVAGITGHVGGTAARTLLDRGFAVRTLARDPAKAAEFAARGAEIRQGDLTDADALAGALKGIEGAFLLIPPLMVPSPGFPEARAVIASYQEALGKVPPPRLVLLSSVGSERESGLGNITTTHLMEEGLRDLPFPVAVVRPGGYLENFLGALEGVRATGVFHSLLGPTDRRTSTAATADIGAEIARLLVEGWDGRRVVELGAMLSPDEIAAGMAAALGRDVRAQAVPREAWAAALERIGLPKGQTGLYEEMTEGFQSGWIGFGTPGAVRVEGTTSPAEVYAGFGKV